MDKLIVYPKTKKQLNAVKAILKGLDVPFTLEEGYDPEFVAKIERSKKEYAAGNYIVYDPTKSLFKNITE